MSLSLSLAPPTWRVGSLRRGNIRTKVRKITFASHYLSHNFFASLSLSLSLSLFSFPSLYLSLFLFPTLCIPCLSFFLSVFLSFFFFLLCICLPIFFFLSSFLYISLSFCTVPLTYLVNPIVFSPLINKRQI